MSMRVLASAYACGPDWGSEVGMGWNWVLHLARHCRLTVITEQSFQPSVERALSAIEVDCRPEFHFIPIADRARDRFWRQNDWRFYWDYEKWQWQAYQLAQELVRTDHFDVVHQLNMIGFREPGYLWRLSLPYVWGPVGGHAQMPWRFISTLGGRNAGYYLLRNIANAIQMRCSARVRRATKMADMVISATAADQKAFERIHDTRTMLINEIGTALAEDGVIHKHDGSRPLRIVWCGKVIGGKALPLALRALAQVRVTTHLDIIGAGPDEAKCRSLAEALGLGPCLSWHGRIPHSLALEIMSSCDCLLLTSLLDATSTVVMEAISFGLPVICHDSCGFGAVVDETCGIKVPVYSPSVSVAGFAGAIDSLARDPGEVERLSRGALARVQQLGWDEKARLMVSIYHAAVEKRQGVAALSGCRP